MKKYSEKIEGMHCATCAINIKDRIASLDGVSNATVNYASKQINVEYDEKKINEQDFKKEIKDLGYLVSSKSNKEENSYLKKERRKLYFLIPIALSIFFLMIWNMLMMEIFKNDQFMIEIKIFDEILFLISSLVLLIAGRPFLNGLTNFLSGKGADMNTLIGLGTGAAYIYSTIILILRYFNTNIYVENVLYFEALIIVISFVVWGKYLEEKSKASTGSAIKELASLQSVSAILYKDGKELDIKIEDIKINDILLVKPGSKIPTDGLIIDGDALIDQSMLTGEPVPVLKKINENVFGGTINKQGFLKIKATKVGKDTVLARIIELVENAQNSRAPIEKLVDKISRVFVPLIIILAILSFIIWTISGNVSMGISALVSTLVIACPCALGLATPTAIIVGVGKGAKNGILIKDVEKMQNLSNVDTIVFDKTGTITYGKPQVTKIITTKNEAEILTIAASLESKSQHPLAYAMKEKTKELGLKIKPVKNFKNIDGKGLEGMIGNEQYFLGSPTYIKSLNIEIDDTDIDSTAIVLADRKNVLAKIFVEDQIKEDAKDTIKHIHSLGIKTVLLSGDNEKTVNKIAKFLNIDEFYSNVLPEDKSKIINTLKKEKTIAMVGDGINDAPALALADVGIAMATGTDIAIESSDIILLGGNLEKIPMSIKLSKDIMLTIKQNLFWAFIYNIIGIPLAMGVFYPIFKILINPAFAGMAMSFSSISVVLNSLRLKFKKV